MNSLKSFKVDILGTVYNIVLDGRGINPGLEDRVGYCDMFDSVAQATSGRTAASVVDATAGVFAAARSGSLRTASCSRPLSVWT